MEILGGAQNRLISSVSDIGRASMLAFSTFRALFKRPYELDQIFRQLYHVGVKALPVVLMTGIVVGLVATVQAYHQLKAMSAQGMMGGYVCLYVVKELAPMLTGFVTAARVGTGITAELGTMKVTEQVDALRSMATSPVKYLVVPRFIACVIMLPISIVFADVTGILGGMFMGISLDMAPSFFLRQAEGFLFVGDIVAGLVKGVFFGIIIAVVGCHRGLSASGGAEGVGQATASSAVQSFILIMIADFVLNYCIYTVLNIG